MTFSTMITAHAGAENTPANALSGIRTLCALGADAIEVDVREVDGQLVLTHDAPASARGLTLLEDALVEVQKQECLKINCDLKDFGLTRSVAALAASLGMADRVVLTGDLDDAEIALAREAGMDVWLNSSLLPEGTDPLEGAAEKGLSIANLDLKTASPLLERAPERLSIWTINDPADLVRLLRAGVRNITTRAPIQALKLRAALQPGDSEAIAQFHRDWDVFPGSARLIDARHIVLAANEAARRAGFAEGALCSAVPTANRHRDCLMPRAFASGRGEGNVTGGMMRYWLPVTGRPDLVVHLSFQSPAAQKP